MVYMEHPISMDDLGVPIFRDPPRVLQNKHWVLGIQEEAPPESISILFWPFFMGTWSLGWVA